MKTSTGDVPVFAPREKDSFVADPGLMFQVLSSHEAWAGGVRWGGRK